MPVVSSKRSSKPLTFQRVPREINGALLRFNAEFRRVSPARGKSTRSRRRPGETRNIRKVVNERETRGENCNVIIESFVHSLADLGVLISVMAVPLSSFALREIKDPLLSTLHFVDRRLCASDSCLSKWTNRRGIARTARSHDSRPLRETCVG